MVTKKQVMRQLQNVIDPEIGVPITEMKLIDGIEIKNGDVIVEFHLSMPFCPPFFAMQIAKGVREEVAKLKGVKRVRIKLTKHYMAEEINKKINEGKF